MTLPRRAEWTALALITAAAAALRLIGIAHVSPDPFYDAAVRSMSISWHNFFFGAFEPGGSVSIDKPPVDLWLQVASVNLLGFSSTTLKLPEAFAGIISVPLLFAIVRGLWGSAAALAAALSMAVLPVEVITSRSDTMDAVMMALILLALLLLVRAVESGRTRWLLGAAAALGVAFDVKLLESIVALPALALTAYIGLSGPRPRRLLAVAGAGAVYVAVALSWLTATLLVPAHDRPYAIGSTNGSAWNAAFVFNGTERLGGKSPEPQFTVYVPGRHYPQATQSERDKIPIVPASPTRLLARIGPLSGQRLGLELLAALLLGVPALLLSARRVRAAPVVASRSMGARTLREGRAAPAWDPLAVDGQAAASSVQTLRARQALAAGLGAWLLCGIVLFSAMERLHPRYVEAFVPAVAATLGIGVAWAVCTRGRLRAVVLAGSLAIIVIYAERLLYGLTAAFWITLAGALAALACELLARAPALPEKVRRLLSPLGVLAATLVAVLAVPVGTDLTAIETHVTDAGYVGALPREEQRLVSAYLRAHQGRARYEVAAASATGIGSLIVQDAHPIVVLTSYNARVFTSAAKLRRLVVPPPGRCATPFSTPPVRGAAPRRIPPAPRLRAGCARMRPTCQPRRG